MVREVVHGIYVARTVAAKVDEVLRVGVYARGPLFPMITSPRQVPPTLQWPGVANSLGPIDPLPPSH